MTTEPELYNGPRHAAHARANTNIATTLPPLIWVINKSGRRWFILGETLLVVTGVAVWAARHDPIAISTLLFGIAAVLRSVPKIIQERSLPLYREAPGEPDSRNRSIT
jgi:hypothetical protein